MKKLIISFFSFFVFLSMAGCSLVTDNDVWTSGSENGDVGGINLQVNVDEGQNVSKYSVLSAKFSMTDPLGAVQSTNWVVTGTNHQFNFTSSGPGLYYLRLEDVDSFGDTNVFITNVQFSAGHNYRLFLVLGAGVKTFGLFSDTIQLGVVWDYNMGMQVWDGSTVASTISNSGQAGEGIAYWQFTGGTAGWMGMALHSFYPTNMITYSEGSLRFMFRGTKPIRVGIQDNLGAQAWVYSPNMFAFGLKTNNTWSSVVIPFSAFATNINFTQIVNYFIMIGEVNFTVGSLYYIDNVYWCNKTN